MTRVYKLFLLGIDARCIHFEIESYACVHSLQITHMVAENIKTKYFRYQECAYLLHLIENNNEGKLLHFYVEFTCITTLLNGFPSTLRQWRSEAHALQRITLHGAR